MSGIADFVAYLNSFGVLGGGVLLLWALYTERLRFGRDFNDLEEENAKCRAVIELRDAEIRKLWEDKVTEKEKAADVALAYVRIREEEKH